MEKEKPKRKGSRSKEKRPGSDEKKELAGENQLKEKKKEQSSKAEGTFVVVWGLPQKSGKGFGGGGSEGGDTMGL